MSALGALIKVLKLVSLHQKMVVIGKTKVKNLYLQDKVSTNRFLNHCP